MIFVVSSVFVIFRFAASPAGAARSPACSVGDGARERGCPDCLEGAPIMGPPPGARTAAFGLLSALTISPLPVFGIQSPGRWWTSARFTVSRSSRGSLCKLANVALYFFAPIAPAAGVLADKGGFPAELGRTIGAEPPL